MKEILKLLPEEEAAANDLINFYLQGEHQEFILDAKKALDDKDYVQLFFVNDRYDSYLEMVEESALSAIIGIKKLRALMSIRINKYSQEYLEDLIKRGDA